MQHLFHCLIQHSLFFCFDQQTAFAIFYAFPGSPGILLVITGRPVAGRFQKDVAHAFMVAGKNNTVCFCIKWAAGLTESRKNRAISKLFQFFYLLFVDIFKESGQIKDKVFVFFFQPPNGVKEFFYSFFFHDVVRDTEKGHIYGSGKVPFCIFPG